MFLSLRIPGLLVCFVSRIAVSQNVAKNQVRTMQGTKQPGFLKATSGNDVDIICLLGMEVNGASH